MNKPLSALPAKMKAEEGNPRVVMGRQDYDEIAVIARVATHPATRITDDLYDYLLNVLPPLSPPGCIGYMMSEFLTDSPAGPVTIQFYRREPGVCYAKYVVYGAKDTYISDYNMSNSLPVDPTDADGYV